MLAIIMFMVFITAFLFVQAMLKAVGASQHRINKRMDELNGLVEAYDHRESAMNESLSKRLMKPAVEGFGHFMFALSPQAKREKLEMLLKRAGRTEKSAVGHWYINKLIFSGVFPVIVGGIYYARGTEMLSVLLRVAVIGITAQYVQTFMLKRKITAHQKEIRNNIPDSLDLITVSVEAGLSFDGAMDRVIKQMPSALSAEMSTALKEMRMGMARSDALRSLSMRCDVDDLTTLVGALIQADELGVSIGKVLRIQSHQMREKRRQRAREKAMKAPVKMLFPLVFFIFPTIFAILIGPAVLQMIESFK